ncbi:hypothetical protein [Cerasicoccus arenae]|uniref:Uncharacterized protein n=1 Tax=Cerasicoccus arenae TaxID=424488 RepID=A0A8J3DC69_9BACT|nr:hypothetical protein [Cerasicoccus arenae]MBK1860052.1 hypothetical protein [Cerasicoccus arenae]GHC08461.1 hypothetical protein GCM10007047_27190 [Cerasicoccus arenae]
MPIFAIQLPDRKLHAPYRAKAGSVDPIIFASTNDPQDALHFKSESAAKDYLLANRGDGLKGQLVQLTDGGYWPIE